MELADGRVMLNIRHEGEPHLRAVVIGQDGATGWGKVRFDAALPEPVCMASLVRSGERTLLFGNPHNPSGRERRNLTVKLSDDGGATWPVARTLEAGPSGYSDLAVAPAATSCACTSGSGTLTLARFDEAWVARAAAQSPRAATRCPS